MAVQKPRSPLESAIKRTILGYLKKNYPRAVVRKRHGSNYVVAGDPDLYFLLDGVHYEVELKQIGESPSPLQAVRLSQWAAAGAKTTVVHSLAEFQTFLSACQTTR